MAIKLKNVTDKPHQRLTLLYTAIMTVSLFGFVLLCYFSLSFVFMKEQQTEMIHLAQNEIQAHGEWFAPPVSPRTSQTNFEQTPRSLEIEGNTFYFFVYADGQVHNINEPPAFREAVLRQAGAWQGIHSAIIQTQSANEAAISLAVAAYPVYRDEQFVGTLYTGKNIEAYQHFLQRLLQILAFFMIVFILVAAISGHLLAGRTLIPIERALIRQQRFVDDASHELRTPLTIILASLEVITRNDSERLTAMSRQLLADSKDEVRRLAHLVANMLTLARNDSGTAEIQPAIFDFRPDAERVVRSFQGKANDKNLMLQLHAPETIFLYADRERMIQLLTILVDNAIQYTVAGWVKVEIRFIKEAKSFLQIAVQDTGIGLSDGDKKKIFDRFYRVDAARTRENGGFGLGLSIAEWIVESHDGVLSVESTAGAGSKFTIEIPVRIDKEESRCGNDYKK